MNAHPFKLAGGWSALAITAMFVASSGSAEGQSAAAPAPQLSGDGGSAQGQSGSELQEIVVVARRVSERDVAVPITVNALLGKSLDKLQIYRTDDLAQRVPALQVIQDPQNNNSFTIRGVGRTFEGDDGVVTYVAEVPQQVYGGAPLFDLQSVEVLKGPQGTLFGKSAVGGAVLIVPQLPTTDDFKGFFSARVGNFATREFTGALNIPIGDQLAIRVAGRDTQRDPIIENIEGPDLGDFDRQAGRLSVLFEPIDGIQNVTMLDGYTSGEHPNFDTMVGEVGVCPQNVIGCLYDLVGKPLSAGLARQLALGIDKVAQPGTDVSLQTSTIAVWGVTNTTTINLDDLFHVGDDITLKNIVGYREVQQNIHGDLTGFDPILLSENDPQYHDTVTEELQLRGSSLNHRLDWVIGGFYSDIYDKQNDSRSFIFQDLTSIPGIPPVPNIDDTHLRSRSEALFAQITYDFSQWVDGLKFTAGYRNTWDQRHFDNAQWVGVKSAATCTNQVNGVYLSNTDPKTCQRNLFADYGKPTWNINLDYQFVPNSYVYVATERGYKSGSFNPSAPGTATGVVSYYPELLTNYEIGIKSEGRVAGMSYRVNAAAYTGNYSGIQAFESILQGGQFAVVVVNVGEASVFGYEVSGTLLPLPGLEIGGYYAYTNGRYAHDTSLGSIYNGKNFTAVPKITAGLNGDYTLDLPDDLGAVSLSANLHYTGRAPTVYIAGGDAAFDAVGGYTTVDMALDWENVAGKGLDLRFYVENLTNNRAAYTSVDELPALGYAARSYLDPRMYGFEATYRF